MEATPELPDGILVRVGLERDPETKAMWHRRDLWVKTALRLLGAIALAWLLAASEGAQEAQKGSGAAADQGTFLPRGKKLILKDGTIQLIQSYEIQGERVRYYSVERSQWEEIPTALVDWDATRKAEREETSKDQALVEKVHAEEAARRAAPVDIDASIEVMPGVFLPPGEGVFVLDGKAVLPLTQAEADEKLSKSHLLKQVLVPIPVVSTRRNIILKGGRAAFRISFSQPEFYMRTEESSEPNLDLIRAKVHGGTRLIEHVDVLFTMQKERRESLPLQLWPVTKGVYRFTLGQPLAPGEYVLAERAKGEGLNLYVWDFGVDAAAKSPAGKPN